MTGQVGLWAAAAGLALILLLLARRPLAAAGRLALRSGVGLCLLWVFDQLGALIGVRVGVNLVSGLVLGVLGAPGLGLLLLTQWALG
jgi:inhibitor of the pro-sigma K processing machinery